MPAEGKCTQLLLLPDHLQHARQMRFGANLNRFEDIGVDLNAGVCSTMYNC